MTLWAICRIELGLSEAEFWKTTPAQFSALYDRHIERSRQEWERSAQICSLLANIHRDRKKRQRPFEVKEFMPDFSTTQKPKREQQTPDEMADIFEAMTRAEGKAVE